MIEKQLLKKVTYKQMKKDNNGYKKIKNIILDIDQYYKEAELREILQQILFICEDNIEKEPSNSDQTENR